MITYNQIIKNIQTKLKHRSDLIMERVGVLHYRNKDEKQDYPYYRIISTHIGANDKILLIRATIHGDEPAGSFTIMNRIGEIADYAYKNNVRLVIFPMDNPSGYERKQRYNMENDSGSGNNDFVRYELADGRIVDDIGTSKMYKTWRWASDPSLGIHLPKETSMLHRELKKLPLKQIKAVADIHQDNYIILPGAYAYAFGNTSVYKNIADEIAKITTVFKNEHIDSGYLNGPSFVAEHSVNGQIVPDEFDPVTDNFGFIERHDCSLPDLFFHLGSKHNITVETTTKNSPEVCDKVNMIWIRGLIDLIASEHS